ncbi:CHAT domain-containing protein [Pseudoduganella umbonata]|uniref:CHAT domain-containing protein n=1 Tax=Pseudoduganella umbonata TaxID=864828 RepID=A0A4P8HIZ6_9BURK|nr:CHAT domain-containing protein [Pseudoduganella umbonata]MBB3219592.1 tetratricopeptide (TPR) repeat protein [Pseudoduganella umbonata]QCP09659.1 CHAT domain-containing protein [Pseudoduganella umbonata]
MDTPVTFRIAGTPLAAATARVAPGAPDLPLRCAYGLQARRDAAPAIAVDAVPGRDVVALKIAGGPLLLLHPEHARDLLAAARGTKRGGDGPGGEAAVDVPVQLPWPDGGTRRDGGTGSAILEWFGVLDAPQGDAADAGQAGQANSAAETIAAAIDGQVAEGLYRLGADTLPDRFAPEERVTAWPEQRSPAPLLVFMHGTFVDTGRTFGKLWLRNAATVERLLADYPERTFAFEHPTICKSPIGNAIALADSLPDGAVLHLVTHSRAGLVAEALLRAARFEPDDALDRLFADAPAARQELRDLHAILRKKTITVQRVVRCACPARGTLLASRRLDVFLSLFQWLLGLAGVNVTSQFVDLLCAVARRRTSAATMPGLQAMMPDSAFIRWLNAPLDGEGVDSELYVVAGDAGGDGMVSWLKALVADGFFWTGNDMVVQTRAMYGGVPRAAGRHAPQFRLFTGPEATHFSYFARPDVMAPVRAALLGEPGGGWQPVGPESAAGRETGGSRGPLDGAPEGSGQPAASTGADAADDERLTVRVHHGDLRFVKTPLLLGHYQSLVLSGTEAVVDTLVGGRMAKALRAGIYPDRLGSYQIVENGPHDVAGQGRQRMIPRPRAAIVVGLGEEGELTAQQLAYTIRIGVLAFAGRLMESAVPPARFELAATLAGSGGSGVSVGAAALALAQGIADANVRLRELGWPPVDALTIVEVYLDRATDAWRVLRMQAAATPDRLAVDGYLRQGEGALRRPLESSYRGASYDFISVLQVEGSSPRMPLIAFSLDTRRARTEVRARQAQGALVRDLVEGASNSARADGQIGRTLFNLLIPVEIEPYLAGSASMVMELDETTSTLPWELLDTDPEVPEARRGDAAPWAIRCKVIRKLRMREYREQVVDAGTEDNMLVIGEPLTDPGYGRLAGARREAAAIAAAARAAFGMHGDRVTAVEPQADARRIINQLFARNYRIVHVAGHGTGPQPGGDSTGGGDGNGSTAAPNDSASRYGGVVLSGQATYLGVNEIMAMRVTPELVFLNCCHLAQGSLKPPYDRAAFAAGLAGALIEIGVRCVIAAGWAIEDSAAELFAQTFYSELFAGQRFIDAVGEARRAAWQLDPGGNTWAAYQCYGDPDWSWKAPSGSHHPPPAEEYAGVASPVTLILVLQAIATEALYSQREDTQRNRARLAWLEQAFAAQGWTAQGDVAQAFGAAYAALPDRQEAMKWLRRAVDAADGSAALNAVELLAEQASLPGSTLDELTAATGYLGGLVARLPPTPMRLGLLGNAWRRISMLQHAAGDPAAAASLDMARQHFDRAARCPVPGAVHNHFPTRARIACEARTHLLAEAAAGTVAEPDPFLPTGPVAHELATLARDIDAAANADPKFWSIVAQSEYDILTGVVYRDLASAAPGIVESLQDLHRRIRTRRYWVHVEDDARALLEPYLATLRAGRQANADSERQAAQRLLDLLAGYAGTAAGAVAGAGAMAAAAAPA